MKTLKFMLFGLHEVSQCPEIFSHEFDNLASVSNPFSGRRKEKLIFQPGRVSTADGPVSTGEEKKKSRTVSWSQTATRSPPSFHVTGLWEMQVGKSWKNWLYFNLKGSDPSHRMVSRIKLILGVLSESSCSALPRIKRVQPAITFILNSKVDLLSKKSLFCCI